MFSWSKEWACYLAIVLSLICTNIEYFFRIIFRRVSSWEEIDIFIKEKNLSLESTPEEISDAIRRNFIWRKDRWFLDFAKHPRVFHFDGKDDCDGHAMFAEYLLNKLDFRDVSRLYTRADNGKGHVVCVALMGNGFYYHFGNWQTFQFSSSLLPDMGRIIAKGMGGKLDYVIAFKGNGKIGYFCEAG